MNLETLHKNRTQCWSSFNAAMRKINEGKQVEYYTAVAKEAITEYIDFSAQIAKLSPVKRIKKVVAVIFLVFCFNFSFAQDTIHVDKVFLNNKIIVVDSGYIIHDHKKWIVNGKTVKLYRYKKTDLVSFKKQKELEKPTSMDGAETSRKNVAGLKPESSLNNLIKP